MTAEEFLVEKYLAMEKKVKEMEEVIEDKDETIEQKRDEISEYENLIAILKKRLKKNEYGISIEFKNYYEEDREDIEFLRDFFELGIKGRK